MNKYKLSKAGINANEGIHRLGGNEEMYARFLFKFPEDQHFPQMLAAIEEGNADEAFREAHTLKGYVGNLGMNELFEVIKPLVEDFRPRKLENYQEHLAAVQEKYHMAVEEIIAQRSNG